MGNVQKLKLISPIATITIVLFVAVLLLVMTGTGSTFAFVVEGEDCGLVVKAAEDFTDVGNLNPGDTKSSHLIASNTGAGPLTYFFDIERLGSNAGSYKGQEGKHLDEILEITVKHEGLLLFEGLIGEFEQEYKEEGLALGQMEAGDEQRLDISVYFPKEAGNEYQGSDVSVRFKFQAVCGTGGGEDPPPGGEDPPPGDDDEPPPGGDDEPGEPGEPTEPGDDDEGPGPGDEELEESPDDPEVGPEIPEAPETEDVIEPEEPEVSPPGELEISPEEPEMPPGELEVHPGLPKTGEFSRPAIYAIGLLIILAGLLLRKRASSRK
ncbi:MAG: LPXTG cell wall anchor domain-containing protein [Firmicutes bacterium]|nr:LPXTG cell wall anchor domain-containing protein [Bacillota bacterium]